MSPAVKAKTKTRRMCAAFCAVDMLLATLFLVARKPGLAAACVVCAVAGLVFLFRQSRLAYWAALIYENRLLVIPTAIVTRSNGAARQTEETVVSTFGLLLGNKIYLWGRYRAKGPRLREAAVDKTHLCLRFGVGDETQCARLLHGMTDRQDIKAFAEKMKFETGVKASIDGWENPPSPAKPC